MLHFVLVGALPFAGTSTYYAVNQGEIALVWARYPSGVQTTSTFALSVSFLFVYVRERRAAVVVPNQLKRLCIGTLSNTALVLTILSRLILTFKLPPHYFFVTEPSGSDIPDALSVGERFVLATWHGETSTGCDTD
uniref:Uncharacterized protein n=1 Tax=Ixodes ricinus TaxID=34613 RepID=A0A6B0USE5_IXORI